GAGPARGVIDAPSTVNTSPLLARTVSVAANSRVWVDDETVATHGDRWLTVPGNGPSLPADVETNTPAAYASRKASSTGSLNGSVPPEIEKLMTSTPSWIACPTAAALSDAKQPRMPQTLYSMTHAPGARPWMSASGMPSTDTFVSMLPPAVDAVCV